MSKRITLTDYEIKQIVRALKATQEQTALSYAVVDVGKDYLEALMNKLAPTQTKKEG